MSILGGRSWSRVNGSPPWDRATIAGPEIRVRTARAGEAIRTLDGVDRPLDPATLVIADRDRPVAIAGIMGGLTTAVSDATTDVFFEAAFWPPDFMAGRARNYGMHTDASLRFERGVDFEGQARAVERATELLLQIAGGEAGPLVHQVAVHLVVEDHVLHRHPQRQGDGPLAPRPHRPGPGHRRGQHRPRR